MEDRRRTWPTKSTKQGSYGFTETGDKHRAYKGLYQVICIYVVVICIYVVVASLVFLWES